MRELDRVIAIGGRLLFSVPLGIPAIHFNAHRVYSLDFILSVFDNYQVLDFFFIQGPIELEPVRFPSKDYVEQWPYGCGCFELKKIRQK